MRILFSCICQLLWLLACLFLLTACARPILTSDSSDPYLRKGIRLDISALNYTNRNVGEYSLDGIWASNVSAARAVGRPSGFGKTSCCFNLTDYTKPVKVRWMWDGLRGPAKKIREGITMPGDIIIPTVQKEALVKLPQRWPLVVQSDDPRERFKSEDSLCVVFRDMNTVELVYGSVGCPTP
jgi:hypothetical protein